MTPDTPDSRAAAQPPAPLPADPENESCKGPHSWRTVITRERTYSQCKWCLLTKDWGTPS